MSPEFARIMSNALRPSRRITMTQRENGRMRLGCDDAAFIVLLRTIQQNRRAKWNCHTAQDAHDRLVKAADKYIASLKP